VDDGWKLAEFEDEEAIVFKRALVAAEAAGKVSYFDLVSLCGGRWAKPGYVTISNGALSHLAHHRGQLTVYLRLNAAKMPAIYGPSADEFH
jgi:hypothetical protein